MFDVRNVAVAFIILSASVWTGCAKQEEESESPAPSGAATSETPDGPSPEISTNGEGTSQPEQTAAPPTEVQIPSSLDLSYITDDFTGAIIVHPARLLKWDLVEAVEQTGTPIEQVVSDLSRRNHLHLDFPPVFGADLGAVEQVIVLLDHKTASFARAVLPPPLGDPELKLGPPNIKPVEAEPLERILSDESGQVRDPSLQPPVDESATDEKEKWEPPFPTVIVRFNDAGVPAKFLESYELASLEFVDFDGLRVKRFREDGWGLDVVFHLPDPKTLIVTRTRHIRKMVDSQSNDSALLDQLKTIDPAHDFILVADLSPFQEILDQAGELLVSEVPPEMAALADAPGNTRMLTLTAGISSDSLLSLGVVMETPEDVTAVNGVLSMLILKGRQLYKERRSMLAGVDATSSNSMQAELANMADEIVSKSSTVADGNRLTFTVPKPRKFDQLAEIMAPALKRAGETAKLAKELAMQKNRLKEIGFSFHNYHDVYGKFPGAGSDASGEKKGLSWRVHLLPYLNHGPLYGQFNLDEPWDSEHNKALIGRMPEIFKSAGVADPTKTSMHMFVGENAYSEVGGTVLFDIRDGTSNTFLVVQAAPDQAEVWTRPGGLKPDEADPLKPLGALPEDFFLALMADGSVRQISTLIDPAVLKALITINGGEVVRGF